LPGDPDYSTNIARVNNRTALIDILTPVIKSLSKSFLLDGMKNASVPSGPINDLSEVFKSDQVAARGMKISMDYPLAASGKVDLIGNPVKFSATPVSYRRAPPTCGADTEEVLKDWLGKSALPDQGGN